MNSFFETVYDPSHLQDINGDLSAYTESLNDSGFADSLMKQNQPAVTRQQKFARKTGNLSKPVRFVAMFP